MLKTGKGRTNNGSQTRAARVSSETQVTKTAQEKKESIS